MCTYVEAGNTRLLIDPGATLAPYRFNLPPADVEWETLRRANDRISAYAARATLLFVSHYHEDHFRSDAACYAGRRVLVKDPRRMVSGAQARRATALWTTLSASATVQAADGHVERGRDLELRVSPPLAHGLDGSSLGYVVVLTVEDHGERERFVFASDVQGPLSPVATAYLLRERPTLLYLSGPPSYMEREVGAEAIERGVANLRRIVEATGCRVIMDHHALRDERATERFASLWESGHVMTAAQYLGVEASPLESQRHRLWAVVRKPPARADARRPEPRATITRTPRTLAQGRSAE